MHKKKKIFFIFFIFWNIQIYSSLPDKHSSLSSEEAFDLLNKFYESGRGFFLLQRKAQFALKNVDSIEILIPEIIDLYDNLVSDNESALPTSGDAVQIILVHGTFAAHFDWYKKGGDFFEALSIAAKDRFGDDVELTSFRWTGYLGCSARVEAATELAELILNSKKKIYTIGHSHGGNIINLASQILELTVEPLSKECRVEKIKKMAKSLFEKNEQEAARWQETRGHKFIRYSLNEITKKIALSIYCLGNKAANILLEDHGFANFRSPISALNKRGVRIEENYLLATPVAAVELAPSTKIINSSFSLYSKNDLVQPVFGLYGKKYNLGRAIVTDIGTIFAGAAQAGETDSEKIVYEYPRHTDLHSATIGRGLFCIPELCMLATDEYYQNHDNQLDIVFFKDFPKFKKPVLVTPSDVQTSTIHTLLENLKDFANMFT